MKPLRSTITLLLLLSALGAMGALTTRASRGQAPSAAQIRRGADKLYEEKSYALALEQYEKWLKVAPSAAPDRTAIEYRVAVALGNAQKWDRALAAAEKFIAGHKSEPLWAARGQYWRALLLHKVPHQGYKVGGRLYRGSDYPKTDAAEKPVQVWLQQEDRKASLASFEAAVKAYEALPSGQRQAVAAEEADLHFDLAKFLPQMQAWGTPKDWEAAKKTDWTVNPAKRYDPAWPMPKKVLFLYAHLPGLDPKNTHNAALTGMARALFVAQQRGSWVQWGAKDYRRVVIQTIPYYKLDPIALMQETAEKYPNDPQAPQMRLIAAQWTAGSGDFKGALVKYRGLLARYPSSKWAEDARAAVQEILREGVSLHTPGPQPPGKKATLTVATHNLKSLTLRAYKLPLEDVLTAPGKIDNPNGRYTSFESNFGNLGEARGKGTKTEEWTFATKDTGEHRHLQETITTPLVKPGAYLVEATGDEGRVRGATLVLITDLAVVKKVDKDSALCFVVDARSGRPVPGAKVVVREVYWDNSDNQNRHKVAVQRGQADAEGVFVAPRKRGPSIDSAQMEAFAYAPGSRYALTDTGGWYGYDGNGGNRDEIRVYAYTDRPVYRPRQTVYFRELLARRKGGADYAPVAGIPVTIKVHNPKGEEIFTQTATSSEFGTVNGKFDLPAGVPLGEYQVSVSVSQSSSSQVNDSGGNRFRVEEYKKPEFEVRVTPSTLQGRFGEKVTATVNATYYFGAPVAGAKVTYRVFRSPFYPSYRFPETYDWLYRYYDGGDYRNQNAEGGELVTQGTAVTDAKGDARVTFTADKGTRGYGDYAYTIKADVVDPSRRQISGEGVLKVTNQAFYAYLNAPRGFYRAGDKVQIEVRTQDANEKPVAAKGTLTISRLLYDDKGTETATPVHTQPVATDAEGKTFATWTTDVSGQYRAEFKALDRFEKPVLAQAPLWVAGDDLKDRAFRVGGITLITDKRTYGENETARVLIVADQPNGWVLLTQETGNQILKRTLVHVPGRTRTVEVPIVRAHVPNFALAAVAVRDYQFYSWQQELFVPPARQFVQMSVTGDKAEYRPGETGTFRIKTTDDAGRPVASEVSLAVVDASLFYIQKEYAPDIRLFYYGERRAINVNVEASNAYRPPQRTESDNALHTYKAHGIRIPEMGRLPGQNYYVHYYGDDRYLRRRDMSGVGGFGGGVPVGPETRFGPMPVAADAASQAVASEAAPSGAFPVSKAARAEEPAERKTKAPMAQAQVRSYFPDTAFWTPAVVTSKSDGTTTLKVTFPDTLTTWKATARGLTTGVQVGAGDTQVITDKKLLVRMAAPRFFVERDQVTLSAIVRNDLKTAKEVRVSLSTGPLLVPTPPAPLPPREGEADRIGGSAKAAGFAPSLVSLAPPSPGGRGAGGVGKTVTIPPNSEKRIDWVTRVTGDGMATIRMTAETDEESDAVEQSFPVLMYGVQKFVTQSGVLQADQKSARLTIDIPKAHKAGSAALLVQLTPSLAATTLDALPYLADYPYGCVEQTMSRFLPSVLVAKALKDAGVDLEILRKRAQALKEQEEKGTPFGQQKPTDANTDQTGYTYPTGTPGVMKTPLLAAELYHTKRWSNPVFDSAQLKAMTDEGLARLLTMQRPDGGWGWWRDSFRSDDYMTAYVVYGLATAKAAGVPVPADVLQRGYAFLAKEIQDWEDDRDLAVWMAFALSHQKELPAGARKIVGGIYAEREKLSAYGQALLALTLHNTGDKEKAAVVCRNLQNTATIDQENGTATWKHRRGYWWDWYNNDGETAAWVLKAYVAVMPQSEINGMLVKWLVNNKRGNIWRSTKETAMVVYALTDYIRVNNELAPDYTVTVALGNKVRRTFKIDRENALLFDNRFLVPSDFLPGGPETVTVTKEGSGRLYYSAAVQYFTTEERIAAVGSELKVRRRYFRLTPKTAQQKDYWGGGTFNTLDWNRHPLTDGGALTSGDLIEVELVLEAKNEYDYLIFEDMKPAGCEPIELRSGGRYGDGLCSNMELRDTKTAFFVDHLPQGTRVLRYRLRAEVPGTFQALPTNAYAMYAPDVRALSDSWRVTVRDEKPIPAVTLK